MLLELSADQRSWHVEIDGHQVSTEPIRGLDAAKYFATSKLGEIERLRPAFDLGRKARLLGYRHEHCPFDRDSLERSIQYDLWHEGYLGAAEEALELEAIRRLIIDAGLDTFAELLRCAGVEPDDYAREGQHTPLQRATREALGLPDVCGGQG